MVAPVTGPFNQFPSGPFEDNFRSRRRQRMPVDRPLDYKMYRFYGLRTGEFWDPGSLPVPYIPTKQADFSVTGELEYSRRKQAAFNVAYERFKSKVSDSAGWAENIAQYNKTRKSVVERSVQLANFVVALKRCDFRSAARILRTPVPSGVSNRKALSQNFLEWEYGVKPLISDLESSMKILTGDPGEQRIRGRAKDRFRTLTTSQTVSSSFFSRLYEETRWELTITIRAIVRVTNPDVALANQLGIIDLALPWKLIPFSFIVDWFVNVEQVISSVTDWYGVELQHPHWTEWRKGSKYRYDYIDQTYVNGNHEGHEIHTNRESFELDRYLGIPSPTLIVKPFKGFSVERGAQAIALVLSVLGK